MPTLLEVQESFAAALLADDETVERWIVGGGLAPAARLRIHRNNLAHSMLAVLQAAFPACAAAMGEAAFGHAAWAYLRACPPEDPCLSAYGAGFAERLEAYGAGLELPWLSDLAALEWAVHRAGHAGAADPLGIEVLAAADAAELLCLRLHPACGYLVSIWPVDILWRDFEIDGAVENPATAEMPAHIEIRRDGETVLCRRLAAGAWHLRARLQAGTTLGDAVEAAMQADAVLDLGAALALLFAEHLVVGVAPAALGEE